MLKRDKAKQLQKLKQESAQFFKSVYKDQEKIMVFGEGNPYASLVLVGEAPGQQEVVQQRPFVGRAGKNLDEFLKILDIKREDIYITNAVKFRPVKIDPDTGRTSNRPPNREEIDLNRTVLYKELAIISPSIVVSLGNIPLRVLTDDNKLTIGQVHGRPLFISIGAKEQNMGERAEYGPVSAVSSGKYYLQASVERCIYKRFAKTEKASE